MRVYFVKQYRAVLSVCNSIIDRCALILSCEDPDTRWNHKHQLFVFRHGFLKTLKKERDGILITTYEVVLWKIIIFTIIPHRDRGHWITRNLTRGLSFDLGIKGFPSGGKRWVPKLSPSGGKRWVPKLNGSYNLSLIQMSCGWVLFKNGNSHVS